MQPGQKSCKTDRIYFGEVGEWFNPADLKSAVPVSGTASSNLALSAIIPRSYNGSMGPLHGLGSSSTLLRGTKLEKNVE